MTYPLAIFAPVIGAQSETFIRRHMQDLHSGRTVVIADSADKPLGGHWGIDSPHLVLNRVAPGRLKRGADAVARRLRIRRESNHTTAAVRRFLKRHGVRVAMGEFLAWSLSWLDVATRLDIPFFGHGHGFDISAQLRDPFWRTRYVRYRDAQGVITMSEHSRARLVDVGLDGRNVHVVPYGVDVPPARPRSRNDDGEIRCVVIGRMVAKKPPILNLDAFRRAAKACPNLHLDYVGAGELLPAAQQFVQAFDLGARVTLHGGQPSSVVRSLLRDADVFLLHSMTDPETGDEEGLPVAILEAMAHGLPVVSTRHAGIPEAVSEGETGFLVDEGDSKAMAERLLLLARDPDLRCRLGQAGWQVASERFTWQAERSALCKLLGLPEGSALAAR